MACVQGTWWGVGGGVVGGWWGGLGSGCGFWWGLGFWLGVSGGWWCLAGGSWCLLGGWCGVGGSVPLRPLLNSGPHPLGGLWVLALGRPSVGWGGLFVGGCLVGCSSFLMGWAGLAGGLSCGLCSGWVVLCGRVVVAVLVGYQVRPCVRWGCFLVEGSVGCVLCRGVVLKLVVLFPLGGPTWTVGLFVAPLFLPPLYMLEAPTPPNPVGKLTR